MGRGRAKAKMTKVARELKYSSPSTDYDALQRELAGSPTAEPPGPVIADAESDDYDGYDGYDGEDDWRASR